MDFYGKIFGGANIFPYLCLNNFTNFEKMKKKFLIQNAIDKKYWYGFYTNKNWTDNILEARLFENKQEMEDWIENIGELEGMFLVAIEVWS